MLLRDVTDQKRLETALEQTPQAETPSPEPAAAPTPSGAFIVEHSQAVALTVTDAAAPAAVAAPPESPVSRPAAAPPAAPPAVDPGQLRDMEAALTRLCGQARVTFQELEDALHDAEAQHDAALARQHEILRAARGRTPGTLAVVRERSWAAPSSASFKSTRRARSSRPTRRLPGRSATTRPRIC